MAIASCTRNSKALKKIFSAPSAQKVKNFLRASREKEISFLEGGESLEVSVICFFDPFNIDFDSIDTASERRGGPPWLESLKKEVGKVKHRTTPHAPRVVSPAESHVWR